MCSLRERVPLPAEHQVWTCAGRGGTDSHWAHRCIEQASALPRSGSNITATYDLVRASVASQIVFALANGLPRRTAVRGPRCKESTIPRRRSRWPAPKERLGSGYCADGHETHLHEIAVSWTHGAAAIRRSFTSSTSISRSAAVERVERAAAAPAAAVQGLRRYGTEAFDTLSGRCCVWRLGSTVDNGQDCASCQVPAWESDRIGAKA